MPALEQNGKSETSRCITYVVRKKPSVAVPPGWITWDQHAIRPSHGVHELFGKRNNCIPVVRQRVTKRVDSRKLAGRDLFRHQKSVECANQHDAQNFLRRRCPQTTCSPDRRHGLRHGRTLGVSSPVRNTPPQSQSPSSRSLIEIGLQIAQDRLRTNCSGAAAMIPPARKLLLSPK